MARKRPRKPKMGKMPKANANAEVLERYYAREKDKLDDYNKKVKNFEADIKRSAELKKKIATLKQKRS